MGVQVEPIDEAWFCKKQQLVRFVLGRICELLRIGGAGPPARLGQPLHWLEQPEKINQKLLLAAEELAVFQPGLFVLVVLGCQAVAVFVEEAIFADFADVLDGPDVLFKRCQACGELVVGV
eukprot:7237167-Prymnesium_polylepis.1